MPNCKIALVQKTPDCEWAAAASHAGFDIQRFADPASLLRSIGLIHPGLVVLSEVTGGMWAAIEAARKCKERWVAPVILIVTNSTEALAIAALKAGADDYLKVPVSPEQFVEAARRLVARSKYLAPGCASTGCLVRESGIMRALMDYATKVGLTHSTVLITGETGTGKELVAELIHSISPRSAKPFLAFNCAAIPDSLLESELFGRERGAYTGADSSYDGKLKLADGGSVFFDEIGDLSLYGQAKLLRVLESRQVQRLGSATEIPLDIRIIAATNQDLESLVAGGRFRRDLYFRLRVTRLELPPLRSRREDIPPLLTHFAEEFSAQSGRRFPGFSPRALRVLSDFDWPGNVRQLRNVVEELFVRLSDHPIDADDLPSELTGRSPWVMVEDVDEKTRILSALTSTQWNKTRAAERLCWSRMTLYRKMAFYQIRRSQPDSSAANERQVAGVTCDTGATLPAPERDSETVTSAQASRPNTL